MEEGNISLTAGPPYYAGTGEEGEGARRSREDGGEEGKGGDSNGPRIDSLQAWPRWLMMVAYHFGGGG